jgi:hypothetical protein
VTDAAQGTGDDSLAAPARVASATPRQAALAGLRQPIVVILFLIAFFTTISGKPLDGFLMLAVATLLVWDAARYRLTGEAPARPAAFQLPDSAQAVPLPRRKRLLIGLSWLAAGLLYAAVVGSFTRYSWPATIFVVALGCLMIAVSWQGPLRQRPVLAGPPLRRAWLWAVVLVVGGLVELNSLLEQPHLTTDSYAHPTISALTDPLLASHPGRSVALGAWLLGGWFVVGR